MNYKEKQDYLLELKRYLMNKKRNQSMNEDFAYGFQYALFEIRNFGNFTDEEWNE